MLLAGRLRFNAPVLLSRQDGMRRALKALKDGYPFYYPPDMDFGARDSIFAPFFGVPAATITGVSAGLRRRRPRRAGDHPHDPTRLRGRAAPRGRTTPAPASRPTPGA